MLPQVQALAEQPDITSAVVAQVSVDQSDELFPAASEVENETASPSNVQASNLADQPQRGIFRDYAPLLFGVLFIVLLCSNFVMYFHVRDLEAEIQKLSARTISTCSDGNVAKILSIRETILTLANELQKLD